jgi:hypothetical protein
MNYGQLMGHAFFASSNQQAKAGCETRPFMPNGSRRGKYLKAGSRPPTIKIKPLAESSGELPAAVATVFNLPLVDGTEFGVPEKLYAEYVEAYPAVNVMEQLGAMRAWIISNPKNRKTRSGITKFMNGWLCKAQNQAPRDAGQVINGNTSNRTQQRTNGNLVALAQARESRSTSPAALGMNPDQGDWDDAAQVAYVRRKQAAGEKVGPTMAEYADRWERSQKLHQTIQAQIESRASV